MSASVLQMLTQSRGGPVDHAAEVAVELARLGHVSHLAGPPGPYLEHLSERGVEVHPLEVRGTSHLAGIRSAAELIDRVRPEVIHLQDRRAGLVGRMLGRWRGVPTAYTLHGTPDELSTLVPGNLPVARSRPRDRLAYLTAERLLAAGPRSLVITPCEALADYARDRVGVPADRVRTVLNGVGPAWLGAGPAATAPSGSSVTAAWLGVMQPGKRLPDLVHAAARVPGLGLQLIGDGPQRPEVEAAVARAGSGARVRFLGFLLDPVASLRAADLLVLPSASEACPMALLQAMALGLPVIATRVGGVPEIVRDGIDGLLVDAGAQDQLLAALRRLTADAALRRRMGEAARQRVLDHFTVGRCTGELAAIYEELAA